MGWTEYQATYFKKDKIDRKAECDALFTSNWCEVVKSSMVGSVYYGAIKYLKRWKVDEKGNYIPSIKAEHNQRKKRKII